MHLPIIVAADEAAKTAIVDLIELRIARGMCGKSYMLLTGEVAAVEAATEKAKEAIKDRGMFLDSSVIASSGCSDSRRNLIMNSALMSEGIIVQYQ